MALLLLVLIVLGVRFQGTLVLGMCLGHLPRHQEEAEEGVEEELLLLHVVS